MANEISYSATLRVNNGNLKYNSPQRSNAIDMAGEHRGGAAQTIGLTPEALVIPTDIATLGVCEITNCSDTVSFSVGVMSGSTFLPMVKWKPTETWTFRWDPDCTPYAQANATAGAVADHMTLED